MRVYRKSPPAPRPAPARNEECVGCDRPPMRGYRVCEMCAYELGGLR